MQREKPAFEVIPNWLSVFPIKLESIQATALTQKSNVSAFSR
jgi:hypothetical protein